jgi:indole-3-glycerol phosphate synthase
MILDEICLHKKEETARRKELLPLTQLQQMFEPPNGVRDFRQSLRKDGIRLIAEIKRASPSKGMLLGDIDTVALAGLYEAAGASAISVLTDEQFFKGSLDDLVAVRRNVKSPCLRKDFILDEYQIYEACAYQADAVLLIVKILSDPQLKDYLELAGELGMAALVETRSAEEIERAIEAGASIIGINNRDLTTFEVDVNTTLRLKKMIPGGKVLVSESGIHTREQVRMLEDGGVDAILVGEALLISNDIRGKILELLGRDES